MLKAVKVDWSIFFGCEVDEAAFRESPCNGGLASFEARLGFPVAGTCELAFVAPTRRAAATGALSTSKAFFCMD
jgi:hypothetical protein